MFPFLKSIVLAAILSAPVAVAEARANSTIETVALQQVIVTPSNAGRVLRKGAEINPPWAQVNQTFEPVRLVEGADIN